MANPLEIWNALHSVKGMKARRFQDRIFVCVSQIDKIGPALKDYAGRFSPTMRYEKLIEFLKPSPVVIDWYPSYCYIKGGRLPFKDIIPVTSYFDKKFLQVEAYKRGRLSGMVHLFDIQKGKFPSGLLERVVMALEKNGIQYTINQKFEYPERYLDLNPVFPFTPTEDQEKSVYYLDKANNGIGKLPTGFGKTSYVSLALIAKKGVRTLFLANQRILINDAKEDFSAGFEGDGIEIGVIGDGEYNPQEITVASIQGIMAALEPPTEREIKATERELELAELRLEGDETPANKGRVTRLKNKIKNMNLRRARESHIRDFLKTVDMFIIDEGQVIGTSMWDRFFNACPAPYRYTLTATDTRTDGGRIEIIAATGERRFESTASEQIEKERLSEFKGHFKKFNHNIDKEIIKNMDIPYYIAYEAFIVNNRKRNEYLCDWVHKWKQEGYYILALVTRKQHGENVQEILEERGMKKGVDFEYVDGQTNKKERQEIIERFRNCEFQILIGTSIFDVGFNAKNASKMVRFNAGSSEVRETQRSGRTVRKRDDGTIGETIDLIDMNVPYFQSQGFKRLELMRNEFGDERAVLLPGVVEGETPIATLETVATQLPEPMAQHDLKNAIERFKSNKSTFEKADDMAKDVAGVIDDIFDMPHLGDIAKELSGKIEKFKK